MSDDKATARGVTMTGSREDGSTRQRGVARLLGELLALTLLAPDPFRGLLAQKAADRSPMRQGRLEHHKNRVGERFETHMLSFFSAHLEVTVRSIDR